MLKATMRIRCLSFLSLVLFTGCVSTSSSNQSDLNKLQGDWLLVYEQTDRDVVPNEKAARAFHGRMTFTGDKAVYAADLPGFYFEFNCQVDGTNEPHTIDLTTLRIAANPAAKTTSTSAARSMESIVSTKETF
jgi:uncharacterized protein (TIGR03067 family)